MHTYTRCKFCRSEIPPSNSREAFCRTVNKALSKECRLLYEVYGSVGNWKKNKPKEKPSGSRKTSAKRSKTSPKPLKDAKQYSKSKWEEKGTSKPRGALSVPIQASNGNTYQQFLLVMDYGESPPLVLTGGAILIETGAKTQKEKGKNAL